MNFSTAWQAVVVALDQNWLVARLFFCAVELAVLALVAALALRLFRPRTPRLVALIWALVLAKPLVTLAIGSPVSLFHLPVPATAQSIAASGATKSLGATGSASEMSDAAVGLPSSGRNEHSLQADVISNSLSLGERAEVRVSDPAAGSSNDHDVAATPRATADLSSSGRVGDNSQAESLPTIPTAGPWPTWIAALWLIGVAAMFLRAALVRRRLAQILRTARRPTAELLERYAQIAAELRVRKPPPLVVTDCLESPALVGLFRPRVLIPAWLASQFEGSINTIESSGTLTPALSQRERETSALTWSLRHELTHWKHSDLWLIRLRELARALLYFHPAVWFAGRRLEEALELACDRSVIATDAEAADYALRLYQILEAVRNHRRHPISGGLFATRSQIARRLVMLVESPLRLRGRLTWPATVLLTALSIAVLTIGIGLRQEIVAVEPHASSAQATVDQSQTGATTSDLKSNKRATVKLTGKVVDAAGRPVPIHGGMAVGRYVEEIRHRINVITGNVGRDGSFEIDREAIPLLLTASAADHKSGGVVSVEAQQNQVTIALVPYVEAHGRLLDAERQPVAGRRIESVLQMPSGSKTIPWLLDETLTAPDGTYKLSRFIPGMEYEVRYRPNTRGDGVPLKTFKAEKDKTVELGDTPIPKQADPPKADGADKDPESAAQLLAQNNASGTPSSAAEQPEAMVRVSGKVTLPQPEPLVNVFVEAFEAGSVQPVAFARAKVRPDGGYEMMLRPGKAYIVGVDQFRGAAPRRLGVIQAGKPMDGVDFELGEGASSVRGTVTQGEDRRPAAKQKISLWYRGGPVAAGSPQQGEYVFAQDTVTYDDGTFFFGVSPGTYVLFPRTADAPKAHFTVTAQQELVKNFHLPKPEPMPLVGKVVDPVGKSMAAQSVTLYYPGQPPSDSDPRNVKTAADGMFTLPRPKFPIVMVVLTKDKKLGALARINEPQEEVALQTLPTGEARGRIVADDRQPAPGLMFYSVRIPRPDKPEGYQIYYDQVPIGLDGKFALAGLLPGEEYSVTYQFYGDRRNRTITSVELAKPETLELGDFRVTRFVDPTDVTLKGKVVDPEGKPVADVDIDVEFTQARGGPPLYRDRAATKSSSDGTFEIRRPPSVAYLYARTEDRKFAGLADLDAEQGDVTVQLAPQAEARGKLVDAAGAPIAGAEIGYMLIGRFLEGRTGGRLFSSAGGRTTTAADGSYTLFGLLPQSNYQVVQFDEDRDFASSKMIAQISVRGAETIELGNTTPREPGSPPPRKSATGTDGRIRSGKGVGPRALQPKAEEQGVRAQLGVDLMVRRRGGANNLNHTLPEALGEQLAKVEGVKQVASGLVDTISFEQEKLIGVLITGLPADSPLLDRLTVKEGRMLMAKDEGGLMVGQALAAKLGKKVGDAIELYGDNKFVVVGISESPRPLENGGVVLLLSELQRMMNRRGEVTGFQVVAKRPIDEKGLEALRQRLNDVQPGLEATIVPGELPN